MKIKIIQRKDNNLHSITLPDLDLGNNFTQSHFNSAIQNSEFLEDIKDYINQIEFTDDYILIAEGNFGLVNSGECSPYDFNL